jgi:hypothetical protein
MTPRSNSTHDTRIGYVALVTWFAIIQGGCAFEQPDLADVESLGSHEQAVVMDPTLWTWSQGQGTKVLGPGDGYSGTTHTCFLTGVTGNFSGSGEWVQTYITKPAGGGIGKWRLRGSSDQTGVSASAVCVQKPPRAETTWIKGNGSLQLDTGNFATCGLTLIQGNLGGSGEWLQVGVNRNFNPARWYLSGASQQNYLRGSARCVDVNESVPERRFDSDLSTYSAVAGQQGSACILGTIQGPFKGGGDKVLITKGANGWWHLSTSGLASGARGGTWRRFSGRSDALNT